MISEISSRRLHNQRLSLTHFQNPEDVVGWFGAIQAQDFAAAKWALALRSHANSDESIECAFNEGRILRTHIMRPTWHFVTPKDIRWLLTLTSSQVKKFNGSNFRRSGYDKTIFAKSNHIIEKFLQTEKKLTRDQLAGILEKEHIPLNRLGLSFVLMQAELDGIICSGPRVRKQFTYMLFAERVPKYPEMTRDEGLKELTIRYFRSHGPAQIQDFSWWSGLTISDVKKGISLVGPELRKMEKEGKAYWLFEISGNRRNAEDGYLIPGFDEYFIAYRDRSEILNPQYAKHLNLGGGMINGAVLVGGKMVGGWKRIIKKSKVTITLNLFEKISSGEKVCLNSQTQKYGKFLGLPSILNYK